MSIWVLPSNPTTTYRAKESLEANGEMDWISINNFEIGDTVYIYEVIPPNGRGGIVYETIVTNAGLMLDNKIDDRTFWVGGDYPKYITNETRFNRLKLIGAPIDGIVPYRIIKAMGFVAPQKNAHHLDKKPNLLRYIQGRFNSNH